VSCPVEWRLAAAASGADEIAAAHAETCERCRDVVADQRATSELARRMRAPALSRGAREELAAAVMAGTIPAPRNRRAFAVAAASLVLAATLALVVLGHRAPPEQPAAAPAPSVPIASGRTETHDDVVETRVLAGSAVATDSRKSVVVHAGHAKREEPAPVPAPAPAQPSPPPPEPDTSLAAFREGWTARDAGRNADAVAAFDRATDPVVAEEAMFWAAVCAGRAGDRDDSARRLRAFLDKFPHSSRRHDARAALEALVDP